MFKQRNLVLVAACLILLIFAAVCYEDGEGLTKSEQAVENELESSGWYSEVTSRIENDGYRIEPADGGFSAFNPSQGFGLLFDADGLIVADRDGDWTWTWSTVGMGRGDELQEVAAVAPALGLCDVQMGLGSDGSCLPLLAYEREAFVEWYSNTPGGVEQGFEIPERPFGKDLLVIEGEVGVEFAARMPESNDRVVFALDGRDVLEYAGLSVTDAAGREIDSWIEIDSDSVRLVIDDSTAYYPLFVDPGLSLTPDWTAESNKAYAYFGYSVSSAGDVNNDGYDDVIVGAYAYSHGQTSEGRAYVYHGSATGLSSSAAWTAESNQAEACFGVSVSSAGDVNGDGYDDVIVGAHNYTNGQNNEGRAYVYHGSASGLYTGAAWTAAESNQNFANFGYSVSSAGDVNNDGYDDVIIGALRYSNGQYGEGRAFVYHGSASGLRSTPAWTAESNQEVADFGHSVSCAGDVNGDGYDDVIVGAPSYDHGQDHEGRAFVYHGSASGLSSTADWTAESNQEGADFGWSVSSAGDVNGDGYYDVIISGCFSIATDVYVYHGSASGLYCTAAWTKDYPCCSVSSAGDVNSDGFDDVIIGLWDAQVHHGSASGLSATADWTVNQSQASSGFGHSVSSAGDVNGDGYDDVIVGAPYYDHGQTNEGRAFVYHGSCYGCEIDDVCYGPGETNPDNVCLICDPDQSTSEWSYNNGESCDDGVGCTDTDVCTDGACAGTPNDANCDDGVDCTDDVCHAVNDCEYTPDDALCDNGLFCDGEETCDSIEGCQDGVAPCTDDGEFCNGDESCDEDNDECLHSGDPCDAQCESCNETTDVCDEVTGSCDDGLFCNGADACSGGTCSEHAGDPCDEQCQSCNETTDVCDEVTGSCDDGLFCNGADTCSGGTCSEHEGDPCDPQCQSCNETTDVCDEVTGSCDDGLFCNGADTCSGGTCSEHAGDPCDPQCQGCNEDIDICENVEGLCDDDLWCTVDDACEAGACVGVARDCDDNEFCTGEETCDEDIDECVSSGDPCGEDEVCNEDTDVCDEAGDDDDDNDTADDDDDSGARDDDDDSGGCCG